MEPTNEYVRYKKLNSWKRIIFANCTISNSTWPKIILKIYQMYIETMDAKHLQNIKNFILLIKLLYTSNKIFFLENNGV